MGTTKGGWSRLLSFAEAMDASPAELRRVRAVAFALAAMGADVEDNGLYLAADGGGWFASEPACVWLPEAAGVEYGNG